MLKQIIQELFVVVTYYYFTIGIGFLATCILWRASVIYHIYQNRPMNMPVISKSYSIGKWLANFDFIARAPVHILRASAELKYSSSFAIPSLGEHQVLVAGHRDVEAVCNSDENVLSFHEAMTDRMKHYYTMWGFKHDDTDPNDSVPIRTVKVLLRMHIPVLRPLIRRQVQQGFEKVVSDGCNMNGWTSVSMFRLSKSVVEETNVQIILGDELSDNPECVKAAIRYSTDAVVAAEICRQLPSIFTLIIAPIIMRWSGAMKRVACFIKSVVEKRIHEERIRPGTKSNYNDCIQWTIESSQTSEQRRIPRLVAQIIGLLLASSHQMSMVLVYIMYALCDHPEYIEDLRKEIAGSIAANPEDPFKDMHLLDSFLTEVSRLHPPDALTVQRKVKKTFTLPSGGVIPPGNLVAIPVLAQSQNPHVFPNPEVFDGRRFLLQKHQSQDIDPVTRFTDVRYALSFWGAPRKACPGRWYVSETLKQAMVHLIMNYDFKLEEVPGNRFLYWTTAIFPKPNRNILLRKREAGVTRNVSQM